MNGDVFVNNSENPFGGKHKENSDNFFVSGDGFKNNKPEASRRLNDYDYNILKEDAYKDVTDEVFKLEYKITKLEEEIRDLDNQIQSAKDIRDFTLLETLTNRKKQAQEDLAELVEIYNNSSISAKISGEIQNILPQNLKNKFKSLKSGLNSFSEVFLSKLPKRFASALEIKKSLSKLENISKNVDELMTMQTPYGEAIDKYEQLSKYIIKANSIQAEISKILK